MSFPKQAGVALEIAAAAAVGVALAGLSVGVGLAAIVAIKLLTSSESESSDKPEPPKRSSTQIHDEKKASVDEKKETSVAGKDAQKERSAFLKVAKNTDSVPPMPLTPPAIPTYLGSTAKDTHSLPVRKPSVLDRKKDMLPVRNTEPSRRLVEPLVPTVIRASVIKNNETKKTNVATSETRVDRDEPKSLTPPTGHSDTSSDDWLHIGSTASLVSSSQEQVTNHESSVQTTAEDVGSTSTDLPAAAEQSPPSPDLTPSSVISSTIVQETVSKAAPPAAQPEQFTSPVSVPTMKEDPPMFLPEEPIASISPLPELPPSRTEGDFIAHLPEVQETKRETPASVDEPVVSTSHPMESSFVSAVTSFSDPDSPDPASSDASGPSAGTLSDSVLQPQPSISRKRRPSLVASAAKKVSKSVKGAFKDSNNNNVNAGSSKANPAALTSPSNDSLSSAQGHGNVDVLKGYTTSPSRDSLTSSKSGRSVISAAKDGVKRMLSTKDKSRSSPATPSVDPIGSSSSVESPQAPSSSAPPPPATAAATSSGNNTPKKKQRQQQVSQDDGNASPMLKGMFKGRRPTKA